MKKRVSAKKPRAQVQYQELSDNVFYRMNVLVRRGLRQIGSYYNEHIGYRPLSHWSVLMYLGDSDPTPLTAVEISEKADIDRVSLSRTIASLETEGLIERQVNENDKRKFDLRLTSAGKSLSNELKKNAASNMEDVLDVLTQEEILILDMLIDKLDDRIVELMSNAQ